MLDFLVSSQGATYGAYKRRIRRLGNSVLGKSAEAGDPTAGPALRVPWGPCFPLRTRKIMETAFLKNGEIWGNLFCVNFDIKLKNQKKGKNEGFSRIFVLFLVPVIGVEPIRMISPQDFEKSSCGYIHRILRNLHVDIFIGF